MTSLDSGFCSIQVIMFKLRDVVATWPRETTWNGFSRSPRRLHIIYACLCIFHADMLFYNRSRDLLCLWYQCHCTNLKRACEDQLPAAAAIRHWCTSEQAIIIHIDLLRQLLGHTGTAMKVLLFFVSGKVSKCCHVGATGSQIQPKIQRHILLATD